MSTRPLHPYCGDCNDYLAQRGDVLVPHVVTTALAWRIEPRRLFIAYIDGVHERHVAGLSLAVS